MRVALLTHNAQAGDAIGNQTAEKLAFFLEGGADVRVFLESDKKLHPAVRLHAHCLPGPVTTGPVWDFISSTDLVIVEFGHSYSLVDLLPLLAERKPRIVFDYHGVTPLDLWGDHNREAIEKGARQRGLVWCTDAAITHSRFTREELRHDTGFPSNCIHVLGHPVDSQRYCPGPPNRSLKDKLGLADSPLLLFVGRLAPNKRVPFLIEALARLGEPRAAAVHLAIVGDTSDLYATEAHRCRQRAAELGVADRVHLLGHLPEQQLLDAYRSADLFVMPSRHEGFCIPLLEAMACGVPVVVARAAALPETAAGAGLAFNPDDADDLARQIRRVLGSRKLQLPTTRDEALAEHMRAVGLKRAAAHERSVWRQQFGQLIEEVLHAPRRPYRRHVGVRPRSPAITVSAASDAILVPVTIVNRGTHAVVNEGPAAVQVRCRTVDETGTSLGIPEVESSLPGILLPGQEISTAVRVGVPADAGVYKVGIWPVSKGPREGQEPEPASSVQLTVSESGCETSDQDASTLALVQAALAQAYRRQRLPDHYSDVTEGLLASWKRWIKQKLLGNFQHAYVDVLSRQQSAFNENVVQSLHELTEYCTRLAKRAPDKPGSGLEPDRAFLAAAIERAVSEGRADELAVLLQNLSDQLSDSRRRLAALEARLARWEGDFEKKESPEASAP
jgi:glycosyltransferase involved in cell wall biosynthesis